MSVFYVAALARNSEGEIFATVPDLPGVNSAAATRGEALAFAIEFANDYVRDLLAEGHEVPAARDIDDIPIEEEDEEIGRALIPVELPGKSVKISISIDEALLVRIDRAAERTGLTRSGFIAAATEDRIRASVAGAGPAFMPEAPPPGREFYVTSLHPLRVRESMAVYTPRGPKPVRGRAAQKVTKKKERD
jgi:predicted RNase H-like HicB family nuclease